MKCTMLKTNVLFICGFFLYMFVYTGVCVVLGPMMLCVPVPCGCMYGVVVYVASRTSLVNTFIVNKIALVNNK